MEELINKITAIINFIRLKIEATKTKILLMPLSHKFYLMGWITTFSLLFINTLLPHPFLIRGVLGYSLYLTFSVGLTIELVQFFIKSLGFYKKYKILTGLIIGALSYLLIKFSYAFAKHDIHAITGLPPVQFSDSQDWIAIANGLMIIVGGHSRNIFYCLYNQLSFCLHRR